MRGWEAARKWVCQWWMGKSVTKMKTYYVEKYIDALSVCAQYREKPVCQFRATWICGWSLLAMKPWGFGLLCFWNVPCENSLTCETNDTKKWAVILWFVMISAHWILRLRCSMYLKLQTKEAKNTLSSAEIPFSGLAINLLSSATVNAAFFPTFDDL